MFINFMRHLWVLCFRGSDSAPNNVARRDTGEVDGIFFDMAPQLLQVKRTQPQAARRRFSSQSRELRAAGEKALRVRRR